jgi:hypothetical protein
MTAIITGPSTCDWEVYAGDSNDAMFVFSYKSNIPGEGGDPWDITGAIFEAQCRLVDVDATLAMSADCAIADGPSGQLVIGWNGEAVRAILGAESIWIGVWDLQVLMPTATLPHTMLRGKWKAQMDVTRA